MIVRLQDGSTVNVERMPVTGWSVDFDRFIIWRAWNGLAGGPCPGFQIDVDLDSAIYPTLTEACEAIHALLP